MSRLWRSIFAVIVTLPLVTATSVPSNAVGRGGAYDGEWSVIIQTLHGDCASGIRVSVLINGNRILSPDSSYNARGVVASNGAIRVVVVRGDQWATGSGRLTRDGGSGWWRTTKGDECSGQWAAERRGI
jgi:hypothetical protein